MSRIDRFRQWINEQGRALSNTDAKELLTIIEEKEKEIFLLKSERESLDKLLIERDKMSEAIKARFRNKTIDECQNGLQRKEFNDDSDYFVAVNQLESLKGEKK